MNDSSPKIAIKEKSLRVYIPFNACIRYIALLAFAMQKMWMKFALTVWLKRRKSNLPHPKWTRTQKFVYSIQFRYKILKKKCDSVAVIGIRCNSIVNAGASNQMCEWEGIEKFCRFCVSRAPLLVVQLVRRVDKMCLRVCHTTRPHETMSTITAPTPNIGGVHNWKCNGCLLTPPALKKNMKRK